MSSGEIPVPKVISWNKSAQWYIKLLISKKIPYIVMQKGAGVKEIIIKGERCPECRGKGYKIL